MKANNQWDMYKSNIPFIKNQIVKLYLEINQLIQKNVESVIDFGCGEGHFVNFI